MIQRSTLALGVCLALLGGGAAHAQTALEGDIEVPDENGSYAANSDGLAVRTGTGDCLRVGTFSEEGQIDACEGIEEVVAAPEPEPAPAPEPKQVAKVELREVDERTLFGFDSADLTEDGQAQMQELIGQLSEFQGVTEVSVIGHTDSVGSEEYNQQLSERRAQTVADMLSERYPDATVNIEGRGETDPIATNETPDGRQMNRRVEIEVTASQMTIEDS